MCVSVLRKRYTHSNSHGCRHAAMNQFIKCAHKCIGRCVLNNRIMMCCSCFIICTTNFKRKRYFKDKKNEEKERRWTWKKNDLFRAIRIYSYFSIDKFERLFEWRSLANKASLCKANVQLMDLHLIGHVVELLQKIHSIVLCSFVKKEKNTIDIIFSAFYYLPFFLFLVRGIFFRSNVQKIRYSMQKAAWNGR